MLRIEPGKELNVYPSRYVVLNIETTGLSFEKDAVVEICAIKVEDETVIDKFESLINPGVDITPPISRLIGITNEMVVDSPGFEQVFPLFDDFIGEYALMGHNICNFDLRFLNYNTERVWGKKLGNDYVDTYRLSRHLHPELKKHNIISLAKYYDINCENIEGLLDECLIIKKLYEKLKNQGESRSD